MNDGSGYEGATHGRLFDRTLIIYDRNFRSRCFEACIYVVPAGAEELFCWQARSAAVCAPHLVPTVSALYVLEELRSHGVLVSLMGCLDSSALQQSTADESVPAATGLAVLAAVAATMGVAEAAHVQALHAPAMLRGPSCQVWEALVQGAKGAAAFAHRLHAQTCNAAAAAAEDVARSGAGRSTSLASAARKKKSQHQEGRHRRLQQVSGEVCRVAATACEMLAGLLSSYPPGLQGEELEWELSAGLSLIGALKLLSDAPESQYNVAIDAWCVGCAALEAAAARERDRNSSRYVYSCSCWKGRSC